MKQQQKTLGEFWKLILDFYFSVKEIKLTSDWLFIFAIHRKLWNHFKNPTQNNIDPKYLPAHYNPLCIECSIEEDQVQKLIQYFTAKDTFIGQRYWMWTSIDPGIDRVYIHFQI